MKGYDAKGYGTNKDMLHVDMVHGIQCEYYGVKEYGASGKLHGNMVLCVLIIFRIMYSN